MIRSRLNRKHRDLGVPSAVLLVGLSLVLSACGNRLSKDEIVEAAQGGPVTFVPGTTAGQMPGGAVSEASPGALPGAAAPAAQPGSSTGATAGGAPAAGPAVGNGNPANTTGTAGNTTAEAASTAGKAESSSGNAESTSGNPGGCTPPTKSPVKLGNVSSQSGVLGAVFVGQKEALNLWVKYVNRCNGLNGHPVVMIQADDQGNPGLAVTLMQRLVEQEKVIAFVGNLSPLGDEAQYNYLNKAKVPLIGGDGLYDDLIKRTPMVFPASSSFVSNTGSLAKGIVAQGQKKVALYYCAEITICSIFNTNLKQQLPAAGASIVTGGSISLTQVSLSSQCAAAQRAGADHIIVGADSATVVRFADNCAQSFNYRPKFSTLSLAANVAAAQNKNLDGLIAPTGVFPFYANNSPGAKLFRQNVEAFAPDLPVSAAVTYEWASGMLAVAASRFLGDQPTTADLLKGLYSIKNNDLDGIAPKLTFTPSSRSAESCSFGFIVKNSILDAANGGRCV